MKNNLRSMWNSRHDEDGEIGLTVFFVNVFLIICHAFLMFIYVFANHPFMISVNLLSLMIYLSFIHACYKDINLYTRIAFLEIWVHMLCAILSFGWTPCFQNWSFALIAGNFLPVFGSDDNGKSHKRAILYAIVVIVTYLSIPVVINVFDIKTLTPLNDFMNRLLFMLNNMVAFLAITMLVIFYTSRHKRKEAELTKKAEFDELTGLFNRHALNELSDGLINDAKEQKKPYSLAMLDIDFFKKVNDTYGHSVGDIVLKDLADSLRLFASKGIIPARWGGEEFVLMAPCNIDYTDFLDMMEKLRIKIGKHKFKISKQKKINVTISIGAASIDKYKKLDEVISQADDNLYEAKETGRNKVVG